LRLPRDPGHEAIADVGAPAQKLGDAREACGATLRRAAWRSLALSRISERRQRISARSAKSACNPHLMTAVRQGLKDSGFVEGQIA
jgi:hypothetical protein